MIRFSCEHCRHSLRAVDVDEGQMMRCPNCGRDVRVPSTKPQEPKGPRQPIRFACRHCGGQLRAQPAQAGQTMACRNCGKRLRVPASQAQADRQAATRTFQALAAPEAGKAGQITGTSSLHREAHAARRARVRSRILVAILTVLSLLCLLGGIAWLACLMR